MKKKVIPLLAAGILILILWIIWGNTTIGLTTYLISDSALPASFSGFRIAQVSDLHNAEFGRDNEPLLRLLGGAAPDIIVFTGDLVDS